MMTVKDLMTREPDIVSPATPLIEVLRLMNVDGCRHLPVLDGERLVGIVSDRDVRLAVNSPVLAGDEHTREDALRELSAESCMTQDPVTVTPDTPASSAAELLALYKYGGLPVVEDGKLVGIITTVDFLRCVAEMGQG